MIITASLRPAALVLFDILLRLALPQAALGRSTVHGGNRPAREAASA
jgi:hypothetical protein